MLSLSHAATVFTLVDEVHIGSYRIGMKGPGLARDDWRIS